MIFKLLASLVTGIGGHYLNRRWDRAILFLCLFVIYWGAMWAFFMFFTMRHLSGSPEVITEQIQDANLLMNRLSAIGVFFLWLMSIVVTLYDGRKKREPTIARWSGSGIVAAVLTSLLSGLFLATSVGSYFATGTKMGESSDFQTYQSSAETSSANHFFEHLIFGGKQPMTENLPAPPEGEGVLSGRITYQGMPAQGISLVLMLNAQYKAKTETNDQGMFSLSLPSGSWTINSIQAQGWSNMPDTGTFTMYSGREERLTGPEYKGGPYFRKNGLQVHVDQDPASFDIELTISRDIQLVWPDPDAEGIKATVDDVIRWEEYPGADRYYVDIKRVTREGTTTSYRKVSSLIREETTLPLKSLKYAEGPEQEQNPEYAVEIYAFAADGTLIGEFTDTYQGGTFLLADGNMIIEDRLDDLYGLSSIEDMEEFQQEMENISKNEQRADAVPVLIQNNMPAEARKLLDLMDSEYSQGRKEVLTGYLLALDGECAKAEVMFDKAAAINPDVCIPDAYRAECKK
jgi:hypothetical protein